jgi:two-component system sensor histidine kinase HydH
MSPELRDAIASTEGIDSAVQSFGRISQELLAAYEALSRRAERVEAELSHANAELAKVTERMHQQQKMAALGTMAGGIAHEIRNPLNAVQGFASLLLRELAPGSKHARWADRIQQGAIEVDAIIASLLSFARPERLRLEQILGPTLVDEAVALVRDGLTGSERWQIERVCEPVEFHGDRIQLRAALRNLVANAIDAQPDGGRVRIELARIGDEIRIDVGDAGRGIGTELASKVIEPFFTTRADGTGLGLAIVHTIVQLHGGRLEISSERSPLGGALVRLSLPPSSPRSPLH